MKTDRIKSRDNKENNNPNINMSKNKDGKIPFVSKKENSNNENNNAFKKKIPVSGINKSNLKMDINLNNNKKNGFHKKNGSYNPDISGLISLRPKSTKQMNHNKNGKKINYKIDINKNNNFINVNKNNNIDINNNKNMITKKE